MQSAVGEGVAGGEEAEEVEVLGAKELVRKVPHREVLGREEQMKTKGMAQTFSLAWRQAQVWSQVKCLEWKQQIFPAWRNFTPHMCPL